MSTGRTQWFADVMRAGLDTGILTEPDVLAQATPAVLIAEMPPDVVVRLLDASLATGTITPKSVLATVTLDLLAEHVAHRLLWVAIAAAADRAAIAKSDAPSPDAGGAREFLCRAVERGLATGTITPAHVLKHVTASVLGHHFPDALKTKLLEVTLAAGKMNPEIVVDTLGVEALTRHPPMKIVWGCIAEIGEGPGAGQGAVSGEVTADRAVTVSAATGRPASTSSPMSAASFGITPVTPPAGLPIAPPSRPGTLEVMVEDELDSLQVDLDDVAVSIEREAAQPAKPAPAKPGLLGKLKRG